MAEIQLSDHFNYRKLLRFTLPSIVMMIFTSIYGVVDGIFVSNFVGKTAFAAVNLILPFLQMLSVVGFMLGSGGSALVAKTLGEGKQDKANLLFSMLIYTLIAISIVLEIVGAFCVGNVTEWLGAEGDMADYCVRYSNILLIALPFYILQVAFQSFWVTAEKPSMGLKITIGAGLTNIVLDYVFIALFGWGLEGAAYATLISQCIGGIIPLVYFARNNSSLLRFTRFDYDGKSLLKSCTNGSSEMVTNLSLSVVFMLYNFQLMKYIGENGVAAFGVIMYTYFIFLSVFIGYSIGSTPIVSYHYGAQNKIELKNLLRKSIVILSLMGLITTILAVSLATPLSKVFVGYDDELYILTRHAFVLYSLSFLVVGHNIYSSAFFTALNNGSVSAGLSFIRIFAFECGAVMLLPLVWGVDGIWLSIVVAQVLALFVEIIVFVCYRKKYGYA